VNKPFETIDDFKFIGRNFEVYDLFKAKSVNLQLSGDFINDKNGDIKVENDLNLVCKDFSNYKDAVIGGDFHLAGENFANDNGGKISSGEVDIYLTGNKYEGFGLYQNSSSILESRSGKMTIVIPNGGAYFGYKKEFTEEGVNKDGYKFIASQLLSYDGKINIKSGAIVVFDGTKTMGNVTVDAKEKITKNNLKEESAFLKNIEEETVIEKIPNCNSRCRCCTRDVVKNKDIYADVALNAQFNGNERFAENVEDLVFENAESFEQDGGNEEAVEEIKGRHHHLISDINIEELARKLEEERMEQEVIKKEQKVMERLREMANPDRIYVK
jgi:hypothetical protein